MRHIVLLFFLWILVTVVNLYKELFPLDYAPVFASTALSSSSEGQEERRQSSELHCSVTPWSTLRASRRELLEVRVGSRGGTERHTSLLRMKETTSLTSAKLQEVPVLPC